MDKRAFNIIKWLAIVFVVVFIFGQIYNIFVNPVTTETVYLAKGYSGIEAKGFIVREEQLVETKTNTNGVPNFEIENGGRVASGGTIIGYYSAQSDIDSKTTYDQLKSQISSLQKIQSYNDLNATDLSLINKKMDTSFFDLLRSVSKFPISDYSESNELLELMNRKKILTGEVTDFNPIISQLTTTMNSVKLGIKDPIAKLKSPSAGYVIYTIDGYENKFSIDQLQNLTEYDLENISPNTVEDDKYICKIVNDFEWYITATIQFEDSLNLNKGSTVTVKTSVETAEDLSCTVKYINKQKTGENVVVVLSCKTMEEHLIERRFVDLTIVLEEYDGLRVDNRAIRVVKNDDGSISRGVYILLASQVKFVEVNILYSNEKTSICEMKTSQSRVLRQYDEIIVKGKDLYDGKIIK